MFREQKDYKKIIRAMRKTGTGLASKVVKKGQPESLARSLSPGENDKASCERKSRVPVRKGKR